MYWPKSLLCRSALLTLLVVGYLAAIGLVTVGALRPGVGEEWFFAPVFILGTRGTLLVYLAVYPLSYLALPFILYVLWRSSPRSVNVVIFVTILAIAVVLEKLYPFDFRLYGWAYPFIAMMLLHSIAAAIEVYFRHLPKPQLFAIIATVIILLSYWILHTYGHAMAT